MLFRQQTQAYIDGDQLTFDSFQEILHRQTLYWRLPIGEFGGNKVTSYGGYLRYVFQFAGTGGENTDADVILRVSTKQLFHIL